MPAKDKGFINVDLIGDKALSQTLKTLPARVQKKVVSRALRASAKRLKDEVIERVPVDTGQLKAAFRAAKIRGRTKRGRIRIGIVWPDRDALGVSVDDRYFYPVAVEYGHANAPARPYLRPAVDENKRREHSRIGRDVGAGIVGEAIKA